MNKTIKAVLCTAYGSPGVLQLATRPIPTPKARQLLIRVHATAVTPADCEIRTLKLHPTMYPLFRLALGIRRPRNPVLGMHFSGTVVEKGAVEKGVADKNQQQGRLEIGDEVFGSSSFAMGTNAEYLCVSDSACIVRKPACLTHVEAAAVPIGALNALHFFRKAKPQQGERMLIVGAGGAIGTFAISLAKLHGVHVTAIDSAPKLDMLKELGADETIDYTVSNFTESTDKYDIIFDVVGRSPYGRSLKCLNPGGRYALANVGFTTILRGLWTSLTSDKTVITALAAEKREELEEIRSLIEAGKLYPVVDREFSMEEIPEAHRYIDSVNRPGIPGDSVL